MGREAEQGWYGAWRRKRIGWIDGHTERAGVIPPPLFPPCLWWSGVKGILTPHSLPDGVCAVSCY